MFFSKIWPLEILKFFGYQPEFFHLLIKANTKFGDALISEKHCNFLVNKRKATPEDMKNLINFIKESVYKKTGVKLELEIILTSSKWKKKY